MDWQKVVENLNAQQAYYTKRANEDAMKSGFESTVAQFRRSADIASILASAFRAGIDK